MTIRVNKTIEIKELILYLLNYFKMIDVGERIDRL